MYNRIINLRKHPMKSFFLWGPRQTGKSFWLHRLYRDAVWVDLLKADEFRRYSAHPERIREELLHLPVSRRFCVIDEVQKAPGLLDEVQWLIENAGAVFVLCGSSARKVKRGHANLLGGRAERRSMHGVVSAELGREFDLQRILNRGTLPAIYDSHRYAAALESYCGDYLKEEIAAEGVVRNLPAFSDFLEKAALSDAEIMSYSMIARDCGVSDKTIRGYFEILFDTLLAAPLAAFQKRPKRRVVQSPKFYFFDPGVVNFLAKRFPVEPGTDRFGKAFENWVHHELRAYVSYRRPLLLLSFWRLSTGVEVDFVLGNMEVALEAKASANIHQDHLKGLRELKKDHPEVKRRIVVSLENRSRTTDDGIEILAYQHFMEQLWSNKLH
jgi:predicted AAA+ superfamily ATPase